MKILDSNNDLESTLKTFSNRKIQIVTAFASGTEDLLGTLVANGNRVEIIIGTINSFSSPKLIEYCQNNADEQLMTYVDFRYESSVHWKLYLVDPNIVIIGSANFTVTGVRLERDIMTVVKNESLYHEYKAKIEGLKNKQHIVNVSDSKIFVKYFNEYRKKHKNMQKSLTRASQHKTLATWLKDEANQIVSLFVWERDHPEEEKKKAYSLVEQSDLEVTREDIKEFFTLECGKNKLPYEGGEVVLTAKDTGAYIQFQSFDLILYDKGIHYIYSFKKKRYKYPFKIDEIKVQLKEIIQEHYEKGITEINRNELIGLLGKC
ncbi:MAG: phospholipase D-like domain-containing protein [Candidatus Electrothrix scaldis]|nr:MAG: phospholipase D-like domain-containing protein [Candidatus Electrothrix sp. GW3-3]